MAKEKTTVKKSAVKEKTFLWEGTDKKGRKVQGEITAASDSVVRMVLRNKGIKVSKLKKRGFGMGKQITPQDICVFTRQLATMMKSGVPLLQSFEIVANGHANPNVGRLLITIKQDVEMGSALAEAFKKHPKYFDDLYCNLVQAGEQAGILDGILDRLAIYKEKMLKIKSQIKGALFYPAAVLGVAVIVTTVIMLFVVPKFKEVFTAFGADLPAPTLIVMAISDFFVAYWYMFLAGAVAGVFIFKNAHEKSASFRYFLDRAFLRLPIFGQLIKKSAYARWARTLATMFSAGVPLVEALDSVAGASGNIVFYNATKKIQQEVTTGTSLTVAMQGANVFPNMMQQMTQIGEESGALDSMLGKVADFYEEEVDQMVANMSALMEPIIIVFLGTLIGGLVVAMYLPIFKMGSAV